MRRLKLMLLAALWMLLALPQAGQVLARPVAEPLDQSPGRVVHLPSVLVDLTSLAQAGRWAELETLATARDLPLDGQRIRVVLEAQAGDPAALTSSIRALGFVVESSYRNRVQVLAPLVSLPRLAQLDGLALLRLPYRPASMDVISEGVGPTGANEWHAAGHTGRNTKVAIFDLGFQGYPSLVARGELPASVIVRSFRTDTDVEAGEVHGSACAEIIHDMAPDAQLYLMNFETDVELGNAVDYAIAQGVDVASCSLGWLDAGAFDGTGPICEIVDDARDHGIFWAQSAGNSGNKHWEGPWFDPDNDGLHNFAGDDETQSLTVGAETTIGANLVWNDPWSESSNDYDLYLYDSDGREVAVSRDIQDGDDHPSEYISFNVGPTGGTYHLAIRGVPGSGASRLELYTFRQVLEYQVPESSLQIPADATGAVTAGAVHHGTGELEVYSGRGPTNDGRLKPDLVAADGVSTASYVGAFFGTSAAAPHLAGAAALVRGVYRGYTVTDTVGYLTQQTIELGDPGPDNDYGHGRLSLGPVPTTPAPTPTATALPGATPVATVAPSGAISGTVRLQGRTHHGGSLVTAGGLVTTTAESGQFLLSGLPTGQYSVVAAMVGYLQAQSTSVQVTADAVTALPQLDLQGGDANGDCVVNLFDLVIVGVNYGSAPPRDPRADINDNNQVDIFDLVMVCRNFDRTCPQPWSEGASADALAAGPAHLRVMPPAQLARLHEVVTVTLRLDDARDLYGADVVLTFDPALLQIEDGDPSRPGLQLLPGDLPDPRESAIVRNSADNTVGSARYALSLRSPSPPANGSGILCKIAFRAIAQGDCAVTAELVTLVSSEVEEITATATHAQISSRMGHMVSLPFVVHTIAWPVD